MLALGIPGSGTGAVLLGGLMMWGLNPGPMLFETNPDFAWGLIASLFLANMITLGIALLIIPWLMKILSVPVKIMIPAISVICVVGAYSTSNSMFGVIVMFLAGVLGYLLEKNNYPIAPLLLSMVLAKTLEVNTRRAFIISKGSPMIFFEKPISAVLMVIFFLIICTPIVKAIIKKVKNSKNNSMAQGQ